MGSLSVMFSSIHVILYLPFAIRVKLGFLLETSKAVKIMYTKLS